MSNCCCCLSFLTLSGGFGYCLYYQNLYNLFDEIDKYLVSKNNKVELEPLKAIEVQNCDDQVVTCPVKSEFVFL